MVLYVSNLLYQRRPICIQNLIYSVFVSKYLQNLKKVVKYTNIQSSFCNQLYILYFVGSDFLYLLIIFVSPRSESTTESSTKASREKIRRDKLNERFLELGAILEPGKTPKMDKTAILSDAIRVVGELRSEAKKLKDSNENLQEKIKELK
ncbi:hypothetical protein ACJX0J_032284, partial [Zea mays]